MTLPDTEPEVFHIYLDWLYTGKLDIDYRIDHKCAINAAYSSPFQLWILGDYLDDQRLRYSAMRHLVQEARGWPDPEVICEAWECSPPHSLLRSLIIERLVHRVCQQDFYEGIKKYPSELVLNLAAQSKFHVATMDRDAFVSRWKGFIQPLANRNEEVDGENGA